MPSHYFPGKKVLWVGLFAVVLLAWTIVYESKPNVTLEKERESAISVVPQKNGVASDLQTRSETLSIEPSDSVFSALNNLGNTVSQQPDPVDSLTLEPTTYPDKFSISQLQIINNPTDKEAVSYVMEVLNILSKHTSVLEQNPTNVISQWIQTKDAKYLDTLEGMSAVNQLLAGEIMAMPVPRGYERMHLSIANNLVKSAQSLEEIQITLHDPTAGFFAAANYVNYQSKYQKEVFNLLAHHE